MVPGALLALAAAAGCSSGGDGDGGGPDGAKGKAVAAVCGGFAKEGAAFDALKAIAGDGDLTDDRSQPDETLSALRDADGKLTTQEMASGSPFCRLRTAKDGEPTVNISFREALVVTPHKPGDTGFAPFTTGESAISSNRFASISFKCRMKEPAKEIIVAAELERPGKGAAETKDLPASQITVLNAAARKVATDLGCQNDTKLVEGVPKPAA